MLILWRKYLPLLLALAILLLTFSFCLKSSLSKTEGQLVYTLDDPYIHLAIAKNLSEYGVWGVTKYTFSSTSSSLLWTILLSIMFKIFGVNDALPLMLNFIFAVLSCIIVYLLLLASNLRGSLVFILLVLMIFCTPMVPLSFCGQEHMIHLILTIVFFFYSVNLRLLKN